MHCEIRFQGGVEVLPPHVVPLLGNPSIGIKITDVDLRNHSLIVEADVNERGPASLEVETPWKSASVEGGSIHPVAGDLYEVDLGRGGGPPDAFGYTRRRVVVHFANGPIQ